MINYSDITNKILSTHGVKINEDVIRMIIYLYLNGIEWKIDSNKAKEYEARRV